MYNPNLSLCSDKGLTLKISTSLMVIAVRFFCLVIQSNVDNNKVGCWVYTGSCNSPMFDVVSWVEHKVQYWYNVTPLQLNIESQSPLFTIRYCMLSCNIHVTYLILSRDENQYTCRILLYFHEYLRSHMTNELGSDNYFHWVLEGLASLGLTLTVLTCY